MKEARELDVLFKEGWLTKESHSDKRTFELRLQGTKKSSHVYNCIHKSKYSYNEEIKSY